MKRLWMPGFLITLFLMTAFAMQGQSIEIKATTVGQVNGLSVAVSGVYRDARPGSPGQVRMVDLTIGGKVKESSVIAGRELDFNGEAWLVQKIRKPCFGKGGIVLVKAG